MFRPIYISLQSDMRSATQNQTKGIINQHHGSIDCSSDESGTNFSILIPFPDESFKTKNAEVLNV